MDIKVCYYFELRSSYGNNSFECNNLQELVHSLFASHVYSHEKVCFSDSVLLLII